MKEYDLAPHIIRITDNFLNQRIDNFLSTYLKSIPKSMIYRIIRTGALRVNKKKIQFQYKLRIGDLISVPLIRRIQLDHRYCVLHGALFDKITMLLKRSIIYEDDCLLALNKPSGFAVHGGSGLNFGIIEGLRAARPDAQFLELVHRLDRGTSGVLLVAKERAALMHLHKQLRFQKIQKEYLALVCGKWDPNMKTVSKPLFKRKFMYDDDKIVCTNLRKGKFSTTYFEIREYFSTMATLLKIIPTTGRTHQIRVHTQYLRHPIIGDDIYGNKQFNIKFSRLIGCDRLFLHASTLRLIHPHTNKSLFIYAPIDKSLKDCLYTLRDVITNNAYKQYF